LRFDLGVQRRRVLGRLQEVDRALRKCRVDEGRTTLRALPDELKNLVTYVPLDSPVSSGSVPATSGDEVCIPSKQTDIESSIVDYWKWVRDIESGG
jgi:hypothetical protein